MGWMPSKGKKEREKAKGKQKQSKVNIKTFQPTEKTDFGRAMKHVISTGLQEEQCFWMRTHSSQRVPRVQPAQV